MVAAVGVERGDSFQAISTAFSYLYQRPIHFAFYGFISCVLAVLGFFAAGLFADTTVLLHSGQEVLEWGTSEQPM